MTAPPEPAPGRFKQTIEGPLLPVGLMVLGGYLVWFGVHYWRSDVKWPSEPVKALLQGNPIPAAANTSDAATVITYGKVLAVPTVAGKADEAAGGTGAAAVGSVAGIAGPQNRISAAALKYVGTGYVFGGPADRIGNWDCSSFVSYVLGHDLGIRLPGGHWGDPGFPPHAHGPTTQSYLLYGAPLNRAQVAPGDLVVWNTHMGVAISSSQIVAARTASSGVGISNIDAVTSELRETPHFRRVQ